MTGWFLDLMFTGRDIDIVVDFVCVLCLTGHRIKEIFGKTNLFAKVEDKRFLIQIVAGVIQKSEQQTHNPAC